MATQLQAITKTIESSEGPRFDDVEAAFKDKPDDQVVCLHLLVRRRQQLLQIQRPEDFSSNAAMLAIAGVLTFGVYRFRKATWELGSSLILACTQLAGHNANKRPIEEQLLSLLLNKAETRHIPSPAPNGHKEFFLVASDGRQEVVTPQGGEGFLIMPEKVLCRLSAPAELVDELVPAIVGIMKRKATEENEPHGQAHHVDIVIGLPTDLGGEFAPFAHHEPQEGGFFSRFRRRGTSEPAPGMGASEGKDMREAHHPLDDRPSEPGIPTGVAKAARGGQAKSDIG